MPAPLATTIAPPAPQISGVTTSARAARSAEERPASPETLSIMPTGMDLADALGLGRKFSAQPKAEESAPVAEEEADPEDPAAALDETPAILTDAVADADPAPETEEEADPEAEPELSPEAQQIRDGMQKRIDKLTAQRSEHAERITELEAELASVQAGPRPAPSSTDPLADILSERELDTAIDEARRAKQWAIRNREGGELPTKDGPANFDADQVANILANAEATLDAAPQRRQWLADAAQAETYGRQVAPPFFTKGTPHHTALEKAWSEAPPAFKAWRPDAKIVLLNALVGAAHLRSLSETGKAAPSADGRTPQISAKPAPPAPGGKTAPKTTAKAVEQRTRSQQLSKLPRGGQRALADVIADRLTF